MTKNEWNKIKAAWGIGFFKLNCDGDELSVNAVRCKMKILMAIYVNGKLDFHWCHPAGDASSISKEEPDWHPFADRFMRTRKKQVYTQKEIKRKERLIGKQKCKELGIYNSSWIKDPCWVSFNSFKRHINKHNQEIKLIEVFPEDRGKEGGEG